MFSERIMKRRRKKRSRDLETSISEGNVKDQIIAFLYAITKINDNEEVVSMTIGKLTKGNYPLTLKLKEI